MSLPADVPRARAPRPTATATSSRAPPAPLRWLGRYDDFVARNASQVSQIESALRSLTYIIPGTSSRPSPPPRLLVVNQLTSFPAAGRFRDAEIASETIHSGVQLLSLYHDTLLLRALSAARLPGLARAPSLHGRYTRQQTKVTSTTEV